MGQDRAGQASEPGWANPDPTRRANPYATPPLTPRHPPPVGPGVVTAANPIRRRVWAAATATWVVFSITGAAFLANQVWDGVAGRFGNLSQLATGPLTPPLPEPGTAGMDTPAPIPATDPRPAAAAVFNASDVSYGHGDLDATCQVYALGPGYIYGDRFECLDDLGSSYDGESAHDRSVEGASRIDPGRMVLLVDGSVAFRMQDVDWPAGLPQDWDATQNSTVQVMHEFPGRGWLMVGLYTQDQERRGYVPQPLPSALAPITPDSLGAPDPTASEPAPSDAGSSGPDLADPGLPTPSASPTRSPGVKSPGDVVPVTGSDPRPAAAAAWNATLTGWTTRSAATLCKAYAIGPSFVFEDQATCLWDQGGSVRSSDATTLAAAAADRVDPRRMVVLRDHSVAFVKANHLVMVMRKVPGQGWRVVGTQTPGGYVAGTVPQPLSPSLTTPSLSTPSRPTPTRPTPTQDHT